MATTSFRTNAVGSPPTALDEFNSDVSSTFDFAGSFANGSHVMKMDQCLREPVMMNVPQEDFKPSSGELTTLQSLSPSCLSQMCKPPPQQLRRSKPIPPPLVLQQEVNSLLTEFAIIATSPRSPLMQKNLPIRKRAYSCSSMEALHSYARQPLTPPPGILSPPPSQASSSPLHSSTEDIEPSVSSTSPYPMSPQATADSFGIGSLSVNCHKGRRSSSGDTWTHQWPVPIWHCFLKGTRMRFGDDPESNSASWRLAEKLGLQETLMRRAEQGPGTPPYAPNGLRLVESYMLPISTIPTILRLHFRPVDVVGNGAKVCIPHQGIEVECPSDHPFYVKDRGWSSPRPEITVARYGIPCRPLQVDDICLPPSHSAASFSSDIFESIKSFDFTPEDTSAVLALSNMAKHKQGQNPIPTVAMSPPASPSKKSPVETASKPKRPMNGFMLFAKQHRVEYTQMHPGKDNRAISVLLGDTWKRMASEERNTYAQQARVLAEEQKKLYPDCWKRRRSLSTSS